MRVLGAAFMKWIRDMVGSDPSDLEVRLRDFDKVKVDELSSLSSFNYFDDVPTVDGWGNELEIYLNHENARHGMSPIVVIRSSGRGGWFDAREYVAGAFPATEFRRDIVWLDGFFVRWPDWLQEGTRAKTSPQRKPTNAKTAANSGTRTLTRW